MKIPIYGFRTTSRKGFFREANRARRSCNGYCPEVTASRAWARSMSRRMPRR